jgi:hypothetical protein
MRKLILEGCIKGDKIGEGEKSHWRVDRESIDNYFGRSDEKAVAIVRSIGL